MAKYPTPGAVKTRLAATLGAETACRLHRAFLLDLRDRLERAALPVTWAYWPPQSDFAALIGGAPVVQQVGADLGERMHRAACAVDATRGSVVVLLGADTPHVPIDTVRDAARRVERGDDVAIGPATDGGYYLIAFRPPRPELFTDIAWGGATVLAVTRARCREAGLRVGVLPVLFDVDETDDLDALRGWCRSHPGLLARTEVVLDAVG